MAPGNISVLSKGIESEILDLKDKREAIKD